MTWQSLISFSLGLLLAVPLLAASAAGTVELADSREPSVRTQKNYSGVVVWLEPLGRSAPLPPPRQFTIVQKGKRFTPHVLAIPVGSSVDFPNLDPIFHNAFSNFSGQIFDTGLYRPGTTRKVTFARDGVVRVFCNIHATMSAVIVVVNTPYFATTAADGRFQIDNVPPGDYRLNIWHERAAEDTLNALARRVTVDAEGLKLAPLRISESGYLEIPHKNKHGQDYPPVPAETVYTGGRR